MISVKNLSKSYKIHYKKPGLKGSISSLFHRNWEDKFALKNISFEINSGEIVGLLGANGAGKTTVAKILAGIIHPSAGEVSVLGFTPWNRDNLYRQQMALLMGQKASLWWDLPAFDSFLLLKDIYQIETKIFHQRIKQMAHTLNVEQQLHVQIRRLSLGERMKVELIGALLHGPKVIFLDEPTIGLDFTSQKAIRQFIQDYRQEFNPIIILTSHYMEDIEELCQHLIILKEGKVVYDGNLATIKKHLSNDKSMHITFKHPLTLQQHNHLLHNIPDQQICHSLKEQGVYKLQLSIEDIAHVMLNIPPNAPLLDLQITTPPIGDLIEKIQLHGKFT